MTHILDASAVLAILHDEQGADVAIEHLPGSMMSSVNAIEVGTRLVDNGMSADDAWTALDLLNITIRDFDSELAQTAIALRTVTRAKSLSLGDRACIALALREGRPALTTDRSWGDLDVGCPIEIIR
ncbi:type II toxin-antitoxin system VapC family toxin [Aquibium sp. A9E412]|uniref:type II toxin-antitoxin system VapC family toxin n=1 Tax=Aquibium sp. A9E412 TaxID=2976767 RepID=UPI0025AFBCBC|nr:type II toxin-antitoxin system VapC family toxin [Aquibium sp. A9E412]MDN2567480.1 type II toxin-antitoxin system VapC family toxin [Aquibium sp. A9E412]